MAAAPPRSPGLGLTAADVVALGLTCKVTWDTISPEQYCEFRCAPSSIWVSAHFSADIVRELRREQFSNYLQTWCDIVEMKEDCGATARTLADRGPPMWIADSSGLPLPQGQSHIDRLWFMGERAGRSRASSAALDGAPMDPSTRARLAELHRQVYAYFSQDATGAFIALPECPLELTNAPLCSKAVRDHVQWLQKKFEPMRSGSGTALAKEQRKEERIGSKIPGKYRTELGQITGGSDDNGNGKAPIPHAVVKPPQLDTSSSAVRPIESRLRPLSNRATAPLVRRVHSLILVLAIVTSAVAIVLLDRMVARATSRQALGLGKKMYGSSGTLLPSVDDFLSRVPEWQASPTQFTSTAGLSTGLTTPTPLWCVISQAWSNIRQRLRKYTTGIAERQ